MSHDVLQAVRDLQFVDIARAELLLWRFFEEELGLGVREVKLTPKPTSLNSFNGVLTLRDGARRFFKTHTEAHTIIGEYYHAQTLADAGYPVIQPVFVSTEVGKQMLLYEVIEDIAVFDYAWQVECGVIDDWQSLREAQAFADDTLLAIYRRTLREQHDSSQAPIHQLFYHRIVGGRLDSFYAGQSLLLPDVGEVAWEDLAQWQWTINGQEYNQSLDALLAQARQRLYPQRFRLAVVGHGDAHNGNVFFNSDTRRLTYFDPAFAGYHDPLLDLVKPLFHNVFAMWMYFPREIATGLAIRCDLQGQRSVVTHNFKLPAIRQMFWESKIERVLKPLLQDLKRRDLLAADWRETFKLALLCCPLLTMNLADRVRFSPEIALLGLCMSVEMGAESNGTRSLLDTTLDTLLS